MLRAPLICSKAEQLPVETTLSANAAIVGPDRSPWRSESRASTPWLRAKVGPAEGASSLSKGLSISYLVA